MCLESKAAETNVINDANKDNQITLDEVDLTQLATYGLVTGYGVTGSDVPGSITSSSAYTTALSEAAGNENTIIVGIVADGKVTFGEWFQNLCTNVYAELTNADVIGYTVYPSVSKDTVIFYMDLFYDAGFLNDSYYSKFYNALNNSAYYPCFVCISDDRLYLSYDFSYYFKNNFSFILDSTNRLCALTPDSNGSFSSKLISRVYYYTQTSGSSKCGSTSSNFYMNGDVMGYVGEIMVVFHDLSSAISYLGLSSNVYYSSLSLHDSNLRNDTVATLNAYDWSALSSQVYTHVSSAVTDANATTVSQIQNVIDTEMEDLTEFIEEKEDSGSEEGGSDGSGSNSDLSDKLEQGNQLQQESNELQQENNELQKEENETSKGILGKLTDFFGSFFDNLVDSVVGIFVPSTDELKVLFDRLNQFFSDTFGFLYYPFDFLIQAFDIFLSSDSSTGLIFPGFSIMGYEVWSDYTYDIASDPVAGSIFEYVRIGTGAILSMFFVGYLRSFFDKRFGGGGS